MISKDSRIYVAGHTGLLGSAAIRRLERDGFTNLVTRTHAQLDLTDADATRQFFDESRPEIVFLCAGLVGGILVNRDRPFDFITENLAIQLNVLREAHRVEAQRLLFFGSSCMFPKHCPQPMEEKSLLTGIPEETSLPYALAKLAGVQMCLAYNRQFGETRFLPLIPNNLYGENDRFHALQSHVLPALMLKFHEAKLAQSGRVELWGTGTPRRGFIHVDDVVDACLFVMERDLEELELPLNIASREDHSIHEIARMMAEVVGYDGEIVFNSAFPDGAPRKQMDGSRLEKLGWKPRIELYAGLRRTYRSFVRRYAPSPSTFEVNGVSFSRPQRPLTQHKIERIFKD